MPRLKNEHKALIVQRLAMFCATSEIIAELKEQGVIASIQQIRHYEPGPGSEVAPRWVELFEETRDAYIASTAHIGISHKAYRLSRLDVLYRKAEQRGNIVLALQILEHAAKECGGMFTNRREFTGKNGAPLIPDADPMDEMSPDELMAHAERLLAEMRDDRKLRVIA